MIHFISIRILPFHSNFVMVLCLIFYLLFIKVVHYFFNMKQKLAALSLFGDEFVYLFICLAAGKNSARRKLSDGGKRIKF